MSAPAFVLLHLLLDYKTESELTADPSPFVLASLIQLRKIQAGGDVQQRYRLG